MLGRAIHQAKNLTPRQRQVLDMIQAGKTNPQIAEQLGISLDGAKWHVSEALDRLGVANREQAAAEWRIVKAADRNRVLALVGTAIGGGVGIAAAVAVGVAAVISFRGGDDAHADATGSEPQTDVACSLTVPLETFVPPGPYLASPPDSYDGEWYGSAELWVMLPPEGARWDSLPKSGQFTQKTFWWSANYAGEEQPLIAVTGRRLDGRGEFSSPGPGTNATADFGSAMLVGVDIPANGCWEVTGEYKGAKLSYVVSVGD